MNKGGALTDLSTRTPSGDGVTQRDVEKPAFGDDLLERILDSDNLRRAWQRVRANKGAAGVDGMSIDEFLNWAKAGHWKRVVGELKTGRYQPSPVRRVEIDKSDGSKRPLGIPCVIDQVIQQAIAQVLTPLFDPDFSDSSFGFRPQRSAKQAVKQVHSIIKAGRRFAVDVDLSKFFDRVDHDLLMTLLGRKVRDKRKRFNNRLGLIAFNHRFQCTQAVRCSFNKQLTEPAGTNDRTRFVRKEVIWSVTLR